MRVATAEMLVGWIEFLSTHTLLPTFSLFLSLIYLDISHRERYHTQKSHRKETDRIDRDRHETKPYLLISDYSSMISNGSTKTEAKHVETIESMGL
jgi:hypothetical protein